MFRFINHMLELLVTAISTETDKTLRCSLQNFIASKKLLKNK